MITWSERAATCPQLREIPLERRPANALNVEIGSPLSRCALKPPAHWRGVASTARWLASGGNASVLGECNWNCPAERDDALDAAREKYTADEKEISRLRTAIGVVLAHVAPGAIHDMLTAALREANEVSAAQPPPKEP